MYARLAGIPGYFPYDSAVLIPSLGLPAMDLIHRPSNNPAQVVRLGPYAIQPLLSREETAAASAYRVRIEAHQTTAVSFHKQAEEFYFVLAGSGSAVLNGKTHALQAGDFLRLPPGATHGFTAGPDGLEMLDFHTPGCFPDHDTYFVGAAPDGFKG